MSFTPQFSDALTSHFANSGDTSRSSHSASPSQSPVAFTRNPSASPQSGSDGAPSNGMPPVDRRRNRSEGRSGRAGVERRQFGSSHSGLSAEGRELASAIDTYKLEHRRRYITCDEMLIVLKSLGYQKTQD